MEESLVEVQKLYNAKFVEEQASAVKAYLTESLGLSERPGIKRRGRTQGREVEHIGRRSR